jgi:hypothetical protein
VFPAPSSAQWVLPDVPSTTAGRAGAAVVANGTAIVAVGGASATGTLVAGATAFNFGA